MLVIDKLTVKIEDKVVLNNVSVEFESGKVYYLTGKNGSGKSSLASTIMGNPEFEIGNGEIRLENEEYKKHTLDKVFGDEKFNLASITLNSLEPNKRSLLGIFVAQQYPLEIPGVSLTQYLRLIYNARRPKDDQLPVFKFREVLKKAASKINYPEHLLKRNLNEGFSGGEKKKTEVLQMLLLKPKYIFLDEIDSGLDKQSIKDVFKGLETYTKENPNSSVVIISHYDIGREYLKVDKELEMADGEIK